MLSLPHNCLSRLPLALCHLFIPEISRLLSFLLNLNTCRQWTVLFLGHEGNPGKLDERTSGWAVETRVQGGGIGGGSTQTRSCARWRPGPKDPVPWKAVEGPNTRHRTRATQTEQRNKLAWKTSINAQTHRRIRVNKAALEQSSPTHQSEKGRRVSRCSPALHFCTCTRSTRRSTSLI